MTTSHQAKTNAFSLMNQVANMSYPLLDVMNYRNAFLYLMFVLFSLQIEGQTITPDTIAARLAKQLYDFPQEKISLVTDKSYYFGGDTVWIRAFVADAATHVPVRASKYIYIELTNPFDSLETRIKIKERGGVYEGYIPLDAQMAEGDYTLTAYTMFMENMKDDFFFRKNIYVSSPYSVKSDIRPTFTYEDGAVRAEASYIDKATGNPRSFEHMSYTTCTGRKYERMNRGSGFSVFELKGAELSKPYVLISFGEHKKFFRLPSCDASRYTVAFYPEGGYLVPNAECRVSFKAEDKWGVGTNVEGVVKDSIGNKVALIKTAHNGMGIFSFKPSAGMTYTAEVTNDDGKSLKSELPTVNPNAATIKARQSAGELFISSQGKTPQGSYIIIQQRGNLLASAPIDNNTTQTFAKGTFPAGVVQVLLLDENSNTLSERLVFIRDATKRKVDITPDKRSYGKRQKVEVAMQLKGYENHADGSAAISVTDNSMVPVDSTMSIETQLLLQSDIKGMVENPRYYFDASNQNAERDLDILMMTQGWRRYDVPKVILGEYSEPEMPLEIGQEVDGIVKSLWRGKPVAGASVSIVAPKVGYSNVAVTDKDGLFHFNGFDFPDGTGFIIQAFSDKGKKMMNFDVFHQTYPKVGFCIPLASPYPSLSGHYSASNAQRINSDSYLNQILLDEITVIGRRRRDAGSIYTSLSTKSFDSRFLSDNKVTNLDEIVRLIPGVQLRNDYLYYRGAQSKIAVNGVIEEYVEGMSPYVEVKNKYNIDVIRSVDFIPSYRANIFGTKASAGGVLNLSLKDGPEQSYKSERSQFLKVYLPLGYQKPIEYYTSKYDRPSSRTEGTDRRSTLCWVPNVVIGKDGTARFVFYTSDVEGTTYNVKVEGLTNSGKTIFGEYKLNLNGNK